MGHGGSQSLIDSGPDYILNRNVVLVTFNYRLGAFGKINSVLFFRRRLHNMFISPYFIQTGFLSTEDAEAPGNYGLLDQSLALRYMRAHYYYKFIYPNQHDNE